MTATKDALLEIGSEELPASFVPMGMKQLKAIAEKSLIDHHLAFKSVQVYGTPRRLAVCISELAAHSPDLERKVTGPSILAAKDPSGQWTQAAIGFARKHGLKPTDLVVENDRLCAVQKIKGEATRALLAELFPRWVASIEFPKTMVWEPTHFRYPRPIRWFTALYGSDAVIFALAGVRSGKNTFGLSMQSSKKVPISQGGKYVGLLKNQCVLAEPAARREAIQKLSEQAVKRAHGHVLMREALLDEVSFLVEHPVAILGSFDPAYLNLPREVLITCIEHHQKFFPVSSAASEGKLLPHFIGIRNGVSVHQELVKEGYERVLAARLSDARFFFEKDSHHPLNSKVDSLKGVTFQKDLGSLFDKKERVKALLDALTQKLNWSESDRAKALRVAELSKVDLVSEMVGEFPELQGVMGRIYAGIQGEDPAVAQAIEQHYWPITLSGALPPTALASAVSLIDKLDTLAGDFAVGLIPTGSADPYGLRRAAVGVLRILEAQKWPVALEWLIDQALTVLPQGVVTQRDKTRNELQQFMRQRLAAVLGERTYSTDEVEAVLSRQVGEVHEAIERLQALHDIRARPEFGSLANSFKRAQNIIRQTFPSGILVELDDGIKPELFKDPSEHALYKAFQDISQKQSSSFDQLLQSLVPLAEPLDQFFKSVMVMDPNPELKDNRIQLLCGIVRRFIIIADFSKLQNG